MDKHLKLEDTDKVMNDPEALETLRKHFIYYRDKHGPNDHVNKNIEVIDKRLEELKRNGQTNI